MPWSSWPWIGVIDTGSVNGRFSVTVGISDGFQFRVAELLELEPEPHPAASTTVANTATGASQRPLGITDSLNAISFIRRGARGRAYQG